MEKSENQKLDKWLGALVGAAAGDALGWPNEQNSKNISKAPHKEQEIFQKWERRDGGRFWSHYEEIHPGEYSDDTQLIIATARSLSHGSNWNKLFSKVELPAWISYERGGGGATKRAAETWRKGSNPWNVEKESKEDVQRYFSAGGNGVAMRILPHVFRREGAWAEVKHQVFLNGIFTHGHPRALIGALVYADALTYLQNIEKTLGYGELVDYLLERREEWGSFPNVQKLDSWMNAANLVFKDNYMGLWDEVTEEVLEQLKIIKEGLDQGALDIGDEVLKKLGCFDKKVNGSGTVTAVASIYLASKYASSPRLAIIEAAYLKNADTDTLASMVGGLLGILHGSEFLSVSWLDVQDYEYLKSLIHQENKEDTKLNGPLFDYYNPEMKAKFKHLQVGDILRAEPFGRLMLKDKHINRPNAKNAIVNTLKFVTEEGQHIFVKTYEKGSVEDEYPLKDSKCNMLVNQSISRYQQQQTRPSGYPDKPVLDSRKIRGLSNILPEKLEFDLCLQFIADIMDEIERNGSGGINQNGLKFLEQRWMKHQIDMKDIEKAVNVILKY
ncbi:MULTISPECIES: ADP-ribosylglycohydrolase family protein [Bacillus]|uniref:ADP-ribosylglycohydrolase family protein n=1 Tax=Bacillus TaxID=1386 RepID=UPI001C5BE83B|nr:MULTISPECIES: ADP-ribosylglycohydrolase family protein [Bacillus]MBW3496198.1 ADP-ribosylglycohydrolase family protein [Bacillus sp. FDAARGOS_1420]MDI6504842.1 ADP-ribosylglycohydrolase family protein [Bacillus wiedmannii]MDI6510743.1 ADP-ribosylglycohydrolase family protein [Bacillus wiedmannii]HDR6315503.1 ADP-ribosylglycohydrolase family protein [Bacillus thuringiensis]